MIRLITIALFLLSNTQLALASNMQNEVEDVVGHTNPKIMPVIIGTTIEGKRYRSDRIKKPLVVLFSDSLCPLPHLPNCVAEIAEFNRIVDKFGDRVQWLQVVKGYYTDKTTIEHYLHNFSIKVPTIWDTENRIFSEYGVFAIPYAVVLNQAGALSYRKDDFIGELDLKLTDIL